MKPGEGTTIIGRAAKLRGDLLSTEDLQVDGEVEGTIRLSGGRLTVGPEARIRADVYAPDVIIFGKVEGDIWAPGRVDLRSSAVVVGDVYAGRLSIEENATLSGQVDPSRANEAPPASSTSGSTAGAVRPGLGSASGTLSALPRTPDLFNMETGSALHTSRQMPSALAAIAASKRPDGGPDAALSPLDEDEEDGGVGTVA